ncbi:4-hydroxybenzoate 3-monooxygenase, partial [Paenibacillus sepulcri]|nr:4-hydroxybenzoate 3-monooxygenase [Paenibacillus sepulcri]
EGLDLRGVPHTTCEFRHGGSQYIVPYGDLSGGAHVVYPQQFLVRDLLELFTSRGGKVLFSHPAVKMEGMEDNRAVVTCVVQDSSDSPLQLELECDFVAGCDGFHGLSRTSIPSTHVMTFTKQYGIGWLALLAEVPSSMKRIVYALHDSGFAGQMPRTPQVTRFYLECLPGDLESEWPDDRVWRELRKRMAIDGENDLITGPIIERRVLDMRSVVTEPMQYGNLFLAGDAAHIITPVGAKGMNLAIADAEVLARALIAHYRKRDGTLLREYSKTRLPHVWRVQEFSDWMLRLIHSTDGSNEQAFSERLRRARLERLCGSNAYANLFAESYVGR